MKKTMLSIIIILTLGTGFFSSCQAVFTFSPFSAFQRDPANLSEEQQKVWAESVLASGDAASMAEAYAIIAALLADNPNDPELNLLAANLAIGGSGLGSLLTALDTSGGTGTLDAALGTLDYELLGGVAAHVTAAAENGGAVSESQYVNAAAAIVMVEANDEGGLDNIDWDNPTAELQTALDFAELGGVDIQSLFSGGE